MPLVRKTSPSSSPQPQPAADAPDRLLNGTPDERWAAARSLGGRPEEIAILGRALAQEPDARVREAILTSLARADTSDAVEVVLPLLRSDDAGLRTGALDALATMPTAVAPRLAALLHDRDVDVRVLACELARRAPAAEASRLLCGLLATETDINVCGAAVEVLAEVGGPEAAPALAQCLTRFPETAFPQAGFLRFSIKVAADRIAAQAPSPRG
jgi:HEAT repeat protein